MALLQGSIVFLIRSPTICSNLALDSFKFMCLGPEASMAAEKAKVELSSSAQTDINLPYLTMD